MQVREATGQGGRGIATCFQGSLLEVYTQYCLSVHTCFFHRPDCSQAKMAKQRAEAAVAVGRPLGWGVDGEDGEEIKFIDDTDTACSNSV